MASIESLLNPLPDRTGSKNHHEDDANISYFHRSSITSLPDRRMSNNTFSQSQSQITSNKKPRVAKDAPIFIPGSVRGEVRYRPCADQVEATMMEEHAKFSIYPPIDEIADYPRHIPYSSEKKSLMEKTGRESFEVFQYTFKLPGDEKVWTMMWDYNIGLVRITHLFKCLDYPKTTPAKMLNSNEGLRDICHSITGGALAAQGYWMPFETAKAVAATFCYNIRFALTPLFGTDFPSQCIQPHERAFGKMTIDAKIIKRATELSRRYCQMEFEAKSIVHSQNRPMSPNDVATGLHGAAGVWSEGNTCSSNNTFTPINMSSDQTSLPRVSPQSKILKSDTLPSIKEALGVESFEYLCANPLKRRILNDVHVHDDGQQLKITSRPLINMARLPISLRKRCAESGDDEDGCFTDEASLDNSASSYISESNTDSSESDSDAISELDISSECSILSKATQSRHDKKHIRKEKRKRKTTSKRSSRHQLQQKQVVSPFSPPPTAPLSSSSASPTPVKHRHNHHSKTKRHSRGDELTAAETLLALRSGSSTLSENESEDERVSAKNAKKRCRHSHQHRQRRHKAGAQAEIERFSLAVNSQSDLIERMAKRLRRASF
ncbi:uncharacterized protein BHQ10_002455 [Talaromyces amestolkiae]|uniref:HTH APSES-type domain-containing protein n=1 Tax=Talaromyces amestolkiae TaxID=1196081 RepID=A0A364KSC2_TALAM|nr:uncharacterized protein BHQ10_002455 [Talaromyces amestolkiae]RAO66443.1 hypothetical protein BHQ10_002455 [Talaromyces amestolkiae]